MSRRLYYPDKIQKTYSRYAVHKYTVERGVCRKMFLSGMSVEEIRAVLPRRANIPHAYVDAWLKQLQEEFTHAPVTSRKSTGQPEPATVSADGESED